ncbi:MAG: response regulator [Hydrogenophaga sp.]|nr:response regulator [Gammaproteobacteria bacterium]
MNDANTALRILLLEDTPTDAALIEHELRSAGFQFSSLRVETRGDFARALAEFMPDIILADYKLPAFDGFAALQMARERLPDVPFIFVTGAMGEEVAIESLRGGATDYVLKDRLSKLTPAVERALAEAQARRQRSLAEDALRERVDELETLNRLMVGRELKMVELKKENVRLHEELERQRRGDREEAD